MASVSMTQKEVYIFVREKKREREMCLFEHLQELRILNDLIQPHGILKKTVHSCQDFKTGKVYQATFCFLLCVRVIVFRAAGSRC